VKLSAAQRSANLRAARWQSAWRVDLILSLATTRIAAFLLLSSLSLLLSTYSCPSHYLSRRCSMAHDNGGSRAERSVPRLTRDQVRPVTNDDIGLKVLCNAPADATEIIEYIRSGITLSPKSMLISRAALSRFMASARTPTIAGVRMSAQRRARGGSTGWTRRTCCRRLQVVHASCATDTSRSGLAKGQCGKRRRQ
jgi:hypothetical protein